MKGSNNNSELDPNFVTGLVDGEGCFTYSTSKGVISPRFIIGLSDLDVDLLCRLQIFWGNIGTIYRCPPRNILSNGRSYLGCGMTAFRVARIAECFELVQHFRTYPLRGKKQKAFLIWKDMVMLKYHFPKVRLDTLAELAHELKRANGGKLKAGD